MCVPMSGRRMQVEKVKGSTESGGRTGGRSSAEAVGARLAAPDSGLGFSHEGCSG